MDFLVPIFIGAAINLFIYLVARLMIKDKRALALIPFFITISTVVILFVIGGFVGMGIAVIALGMLVVAVIIFFMTQLGIIKATKNTVL